MLSLLIILFDGDCAHIYINKINLNAQTQQRIDPKLHSMFHITFIALGSWWWFSNLTLY
jgi:hypothetical protein